MIVSVHCALGTSGFLKSGTPLLTASTPVIAVQPLAKERNRIQALMVSVPFGTGGGGWAGCGSPPLNQARIRPTAITLPTHATNPITGKANVIPDSLTPRRLTKVSTTSTSRQNGSLYSCSPRIAESTASTPAEIPTATLSM